MEALGIPFFAGFPNSKGYIAKAITPLTGFDPHNSPTNDPDKDAEKYGNPKFQELMSPEKSVWDDLVKQLQRKNSIENSNNIKQKD
jgi:hypothetical protein